MQGVKRVVVVRERRVGQVLIARRAVGYARRRWVHHGVHALVNPIAAFLLKFESLRLDKPIAIVSLAVMKLDGVNHAVAIKGVIGRLVKYMHRVWPNPQKVSR